MSGTMTEHEIQTCDHVRDIYRNPPVNCSGLSASHFYDPFVNQCVSAAIMQFDDDTEDVLMRIIQSVMFPLLSVIVFVMNAIVITVLRNQHRVPAQGSCHTLQKSPTVGPLEWMAISACLMALSPLPFTFYYYHLMSPYTHRQSILLCNLHKMCMIIMPFFFNTLTTFFTLLLGVQRIIVLVSLFLTFLHYFADNRVVFHICIFDNIPYENVTSMWYSRCFIGHTDITLMIGPDKVAKFLDWLRVCLLMIPSSLLFVITILLIRTIRIADSSQLRESGGRHRRGPRASSHTTTMLAVVISLFLLARLPNTIMILLVKLSNQTNYETWLDRRAESYLIVANNLLVMTVHPISFAVYMLMSRRLFGCRFIASEADVQAFSSIRLQSQASINKRKASEIRQPLVPNGTSKRSVKKTQSLTCQLPINGH